MTNPCPSSSWPLEVVQLLSFLWRAQHWHVLEEQIISNNTKAVTFLQSFYHDVWKYALKHFKKGIFLFKRCLASLLISCHCPDMQIQCFSLYLSTHIYMYTEKTYTYVSKLLHSLNTCILVQKLNYSHMSVAKNVTPSDFIQMSHWCSNIHMWIQAWRFYWTVYTTNFQQPIFESVQTLQSE